MKALKNLGLATALLISPLALATEYNSPQLQAAIEHPLRNVDDKARDQYRHPEQVLTFFDVQPNMTILEIWPGMGWWTDILGPYSRSQGIYYTAGFSMSADRTPQWRKDMQKNFLEKLEQHPEIYDHIVVTELSVPERTTMAPPGTVDRVLTFRNVHNWMKGEYAEAVFKAMYRTLKPGGILGVVEHRAKTGTSLQDMIKSGYVTEAHAIKLAEQAGFILLDKSEINANPNDSTIHPVGVWTLPPSLRYCKQQSDAVQADCIAQYRRIGESDRMTLKFKKP